MFLVLDCSSRERIGKAADLLQKCKVSVNIDHHFTNTRFAQINIVDGNISSTCELIFSMLHGLVEIDKSIASCLYSGIVFDTGGLRFQSTQHSTFETVKKLVDVGIPFTELYREFLLVHTWEGAKLFSMVLDRLVKDGSIVYSYICEDDLQAVGAVKSDLEGVVEYCLNTVGIEVAVLAYYKADGVSKISMRSTQLDVGIIAQRLGGGGHTYAAGCDFACKPQEALSQIVELLKVEMIEQ